MLVKLTQSLCKSLDAQESAKSSKNRFFPEKEKVGRETSWHTHAERREMERGLSKFYFDFQTKFWELKFRRNKVNAMTFQTSIKEFFILNSCDNLISTKLWKYFNDAFMHHIYASIFRIVLRFGSAYVGFKSSMNQSKYFQNAAQWGKRMPKHFQLL